MNLFRRSELMKSLLQDTLEELSVETSMYNDCTISDHAKIDFLTAYRDYLVEISAIDPEAICTAVNGANL